MGGQLESEPALGGDPCGVCSRGGTEAVGVAFGGVCS
jgi:hypothetical protein